MGRILRNEVPFAFNYAGEQFLSRLRPSDESAFGFLGLAEDLEERQKQDRQIMQDIGLEFSVLADKIEGLFASDAVSIHGNPVLRIQRIHSPVCPWGDYCTVDPFDLKPKVTEVLVLNHKTLTEEVISTVMDNMHDTAHYPWLVLNDLAMIFSDLHAHLIRDHEFLEGLETPYRVDPVRAKRYLGL